MYDGMRSNGLGSVVVYVLFFLVGRYVLINMYLAIILACFATENAARKEAAAKAEGQRRATLMGGGGGACGGGARAWGCPRARRWRSARSGGGRGRRATSRARYSRRIAP